MRLLVFGATGATGSHVVEHALRDGLGVRAFVRTPSKIPEEVREHPELEVFQGDMTDADAIARSLDGVDFIICTAGNPKLSRDKPFMLPFVKSLTGSMREKNVSRLLYQAGVFSPPPGETNPLSIRIARVIFGGLSGIEPMLRDNDAVLAFLTNEAQGLDWVVVRAGMIRPGESKGTLKVSDKHSSPTRFVDLAAFNLATVQSKDLVRRCLFVSY